MVLEIQSKEVIDKISDELKVQPSLEIPRQLAEKIQLIYNVNPPRITKFVTGDNKTSSGSSTIYAASNIKDTYITGVLLGVNADATCDKASGVWRLQGTINGVAVDLIKIPNITLTALDKVMFVPFNPPVKIDRGSNIILGNDTFAAGVAIRTGTAYGYETDPQ